MRTARVLSPRSQALALMEEERDPTAAGNCLGPEHSWGGMRGMCFEGHEDSHANVSFVGEGRGGYEKVPMYNYVGHGQGNFDKQELRPSRGTLFWKWCCLCPLTLVALAVCSWCLLPGRIAEEVFSVQVVAVPVAQEAHPWNRSDPMMPMDGGGCIGVNGTHAYDCHVGNASSEMDWPREKTAWCCQCVARGCPSKVAQATPAERMPVVVHVAPSGSLPRSRGCDEGCNFFDGWHTCSARIQYHASAIQKTDACKLSHGFVQASCANCSQCSLQEALSRCSVPRSQPGPTPTAQAAALRSRSGAPQPHLGQDKLFNCKAEPESDWSTSKKLWCCTYERLGCLPNVTAQATASQEAAPEGEAAAAAGAVMRELGCSRACTFEGMTATCRQRVRYVARHKFRGQATPCVLSQELVLRQCPSCSGCALADTGCDTLVAVPGSTPGTTSEVPGTVPSASATPVTTTTAVAPHGTTAEMTRRAAGVGSGGSKSRETMARRPGGGEFREEEATPPSASSGIHSP
jgi:hypothetical protein